jgi:tripartite ATP-independent transporter DctP family solute receptor
MKKFIMKKAVFFALIVTGLASVISGCSKKEAAPAGGTSAEVSGPQYVYKLGYGGAVTNARHLSAQQFAEAVDKESDGRIRIDLYPAEMLGTDAEMAEMCSMGNLDMTINAVGIVSNYEPNIAIFELPFLFSSYEKVDAVLDGDFGKSILASLPSKGLRALAYWENGFRHITNNIRSINSPADLKGLKLRTPENNMTLAIFRALGSNPSPLAFSELYLALSQGSFDGQENPIANIHASKFYEVQKYLAISNHKYEALVFLVSENTWRKIPQDVQNIIANAATEYGKVHRKMVRESEEQMISEMETKGMQITRPNLTPFVSATASVYTEFEKAFGKDNIEKVRNLAQ